QTAALATGARCSPTRWRLPPLSTGCSAMPPCSTSAAAATACAPTRIRRQCERARSLRFPLRLGQSPSGAGVPPVCRPAPEPSRPVLLRGVQATRLPPAPGGARALGPDGLGAGTPPLAHPQGPHAVRMLLHLRRALPRGAALPRLPALLPSGRARRGLSPLRRTAPDHRRARLARPETTRRTTVRNEGQFLVWLFAIMTGHRP